MGLKILLVDDEPDIIEVIQDRLEAYGFTVITAGTGLEALKKLSAEKFDGVFLDVKMPEMGGLKPWRRFGKGTRKSQSSLSPHRLAEKPPLKRLPREPVSTSSSPLNGQN